MRRDPATSLGPLRAIGGRAPSDPVPCGPPRTADGLPHPVPIARSPAGDAPVLHVVIDTEEEFDWSAPFDRSATSTRALEALPRAQALFEEFGIRPTYAVDLPVVAGEPGRSLMAELVRSGRAEIAAQQHPWVCPPFDEELGPRTSFPGNLPPELEAAKLRVLLDAIEDAVGERPRAYKAGRHGFGPRTMDLLLAEGVRIDLSVRPGYDYSEQGGPDFTDFPVGPFRMGGPRGLLGLPETAACVGFAGSGAARLYRWAARPLGRGLRLPGLLARSGASERLLLSPEGFEPAHHRRLTGWLLERGTRTFCLSFHSPSLMPGGTPYARSEADVRALLDACRRYFEHFLGELGGVPLSLSELAARLAPEDGR